MERQGKRARDIRFYSEKNGNVISVHSKAAKQYADKLEADDAVRSYQTCVKLDDWMNRIPLGGVRSSYRACEWLTDFMICDIDGNVKVREIVDLSFVTSLAEIEKLEISHRFWTLGHVDDWKVVVVEREAGL